MLVILSHAKGSDVLFLSAILVDARFKMGPLDGVNGYLHKREQKSFRQSGFLVAKLQHSPELTKYYLKFYS